MENNEQFVRDSKFLHDGAVALVRRSADTARVMIESSLGQGCAGPRRAQGTPTRHARERHLMFSAPVSNQDRRAGPPGLRRALSAPELFPCRGAARRQRRLSPGCARRSQCLADRRAQDHRADADDARAVRLRRAHRGAIPASGRASGLPCCGHEPMIHRSASASWSPRNRGADARVFTDEALALDWLLGRPA